MRPALVLLLVALAVLWWREPARPAPPTTLATIGQQLAAEEYVPTAHAHGVSAPNRAQGWRLAWSDTGLRIETREAADLVATMHTARLGDRALPPAPPRRSATERSRVERRWDGLTEWFVNSPAGVEHGWTIERARGEGPLRLALAVEGAEVRVLDEGRASFTSSAGVSIAYEHLAAFDATGRSLRAWFEPTHQGLDVRVDDDGAEYPVTIDPLLTTSSWTVTGMQTGTVSGDGFATSVASAGDVNGDGLVDLLVGVPRYDNPLDGGFALDTGAVFLFHGKGSGQFDSTPSWKGVGGPGSEYGASVAGLGDVTGDGVADFAVGAPGEDAVHVYTGAGNTVGLLGKLAPQYPGEFGASVARAGDVNRDGYADLAVGAPTASISQSGEGAVYIYLGGAAGFGAPFVSGGGAIGAKLGTSVAGGGDINGDGFSDVIAGAPNHTSNVGRVFVFPGGANGPSAATSFFRSGSTSAGYLGFTVAGAGDVNGDGYGDFLATAPGYSNGETYEGLVVLFAGAAQPAGVAQVWSAETNVNGAGDLTATAAGDVNGDGFADILVGVPKWSRVLGEGKASLFLGGKQPGAVEAWKVEGTQANEHLGFSVASAGDVTGDGLADVLVGTPDHDGMLVDEGALWVYPGVALGLGNVSVTTDAGLSLGGASIATGDVNGDGFMDLAVGVPGFDVMGANAGVVSLFLGSDTGMSPTSSWNQAGAPGDRFGASLAFAGDVNGDGRGDLAIGAPGFSGTAALEGMVALFAGNPTGAALSRLSQVRGGTAGYRLGASVAGIGDVNADGFSDVLFGMPGFSKQVNEEGAAYLFLGGVAPALPTVGLATLVLNPEPTVGARFGASVAGAGDVDGDGKSDFIIGAPGASLTRGLAAVYRGDGSLSSPWWKGSGVSVNERFGESVAGAGDVNADGFADFLVGAPGTLGSATGNVVEAGRAALFAGGNTPPAMPVWEAFGANLNANFGATVASAGDVNGDGCADLLIGAPRHTVVGSSLAEEGAVFVFHGNRRWPISTAPAWVGAGLIDNVSFGTSIASGDLTGDGFSDLLVGGTPRSASALGALRFYPGGDLAPGRNRFLRQGYTPDGGAVLIRAPAFRTNLPIVLSAKVTDESAGLFPRRLEVEVKRLPKQFDQDGTVFSAVATGEERARVTLPNLEPGRYHWRARMVSGDVRGKWVTFGGNGEEETDFVVVDRVVTDAGVIDDGGVTVDAGVVADAGAGTDAGTVDGGSTDPLTFHTSGCGCSGVPVAPVLGVIALVLLRRRK